MGDVAEANDGVAGTDTASPVPEPSAGSSPRRSRTDDPSPAAPRGPTDAGPTKARSVPVRWRRPERRRRSAGPPAARRGRSPERDPWSILACSEPRSRPGCRSTLNEMSERGGLHDRWRFRQIGLWARWLERTPRGGGRAQPIPSSRRRVRITSRWTQLSVLARRSRDLHALGTDGRI